MDVLIDGQRLRVPREIEDAGGEDIDAWIEEQRADKADAPTEDEE